MTQRKLSGYSTDMKRDTWNGVDGMAAVQKSLPMRGLDYPKGRDTFQVDGKRKIFAMYFVRLLIKSCAAMDIGHEGVSLLAMIAMTEDSVFYRKPIRMWNRNVMQYLDLKEDAMTAVRKRCVDHGWLHYERGGKKKPGLYWVLIPEDVADVDSLDDSDTVGINPASVGYFQGVNPAQTGENAGENAGRTPGEQRENAGRTPGHSIPFPNPNPSPTPNADGGGGDLDSADTDSRSEPAVDEAAVRAAVTELLTDQRLTEALKPDRNRQRCLSRAGDTATRALAVGHSIDTVRAVVVHVIDHPEFWGAGALRIRLNDPDCVRLEASEGWPEPDGKAKARRQTAQQRVRQQQAEVDAAQQRRDDAARAEAEKEQLEFEFGESVNSLSDDELAEVLTQADQTVALRTLRNHGRKRVPRATLLRAFAAVAATN